MKKFQLLPLFILFIFVIQACDFSSGSDEITQENSFEATVYDEAGKIVTTINHDSTVDDLSTNSIAVFGNDFLPDRIKEGFSENSDATPEDFRQNEIYLHFESNLSNDDSHTTFQLVIEDEHGFIPKAFHFTELTEEYFINSLKRLWNMRQENSEKSVSYNQIVHPNNLNESDNLAYMAFYQKGFISNLSFGSRISDDRYLVVTSSGMMELTDVTDSYISGVFETELLATPGSILYGDEFPDEIILERFTIEGSFTAKYGDFNDLVRTANHFPIYDTSLFR